MMKHVGIAEAKTDFSNLVKEVEKGAEVVITRDGKPVAKLVAVQDRPAERRLTPEQLAKRRQAIAELREIARRIRINATQEEIKAWIEEGRH